MAAAIAFVVVMLPSAVVFGVIVVVATGCVVMSQVPEESVPSWLQGAKEASDRIINDPIYLVEMMAQGVMDQIQTPEGIAAVAGEFLGGMAGRSWG